MNPITKFANTAIPVRTCLTKLRRVNLCGCGKLLVIIVLTLATTLSLHAEDNPLERLKAKASQASASLNVEESTETMSVDGRGDLEIQRTTFSIDTGARLFKMSYRSFVEGNATQNPDLLNDGGSGYGMLEPDFREFPGNSRNGYQKTPG